MCPALEEDYHVGPLFYAKWVTVHTHSSPRSSPR